MKWQALLASLLFLVMSVCASAQQVIQLSAQTQRTNFLLYERVDLMITLTNVSGTDIELSNDEGRPWLNFQVMGEQRRDVFLPVHSERQSKFAPLTLKANETKRLRVDITPLFSFRTEGHYRVAAVVDLPGEGQIVSDPVPFTVQKGRVIVSNVRTVDSIERVYSLVRFSPSSDETSLYLRVAAPSENTIYANYALGQLVSSVDPAMLLDPLGNVHVLQPTSMGTYLYSRTDPDGKVLDQRLFKSSVDPGSGLMVGPRLAKMDDGNVIVQGGRSENTTPREKLSDTQQGNRNIAAPIQPEGPSGSPMSIPPSAGP
jgi:hypothetical protein